MPPSYTWADYGKVNRAEAGRDDQERARLARLAERRLQMWWTLPLAVLVLFGIFPVALGRSAQDVSYSLGTGLIVLTAGMHYMKMWHLSVANNGPSTRPVGHTPDEQAP